METVSNDSYGWAEGVQEDMQQRHERLMAKLHELNAVYDQDKDFTWRLKVRARWSTAAAVAAAAAFIMVLLGGTFGLSSILESIGWAVAAWVIIILVAIQVSMYRDRHRLRALREWNKAWNAWAKEQWG